MAKFDVQGKPLICLICGGDDFTRSKGLKESRGLSFFGMDWAAEGVDKIACTSCGHTMTFQGAPGKPRKNVADLAENLPGMHPDAVAAMEAERKKR